MPDFRFQAARATGGLETGTLSASTTTAAVAELRARGLTPIEVAVVTRRGRTLDLLKLAAAVVPRRSRLDERAVLFRTLTSLLSAGIRPERAVALASQMLSEAAIQSATRQWVEDMRSGRSLAAAMARTPDLVPENLSQAIAAGETSGKLSETVERIAASTAAAQATRNRVASALAYPILLLATMTGVLGLLFTTVIPSLKPLFAQAGANMPWPAAVLVALADVTESYGWAILFAILASAIGGAIYAGSEAGRGRLDRALWRSGLLGRMPAKAAASGFARDLGLLLSGGVTLSRAFDLAIAAVGNVHFRSQLLDAKRSIRQGKTLKASLASISSMPALLVEMAGVGDETGKHADAVLRAADILEREVQQGLDRATAMILPVLTLVLGAIVAMIMTGIVTGILAANELAL
jgi:MSHA biogenesis protein MshG